MMKSIYVLDVSGYLFRSYYALPRMTNPQGESTHALLGFIRSVLKILKDFSPTHLVAVFDGEENKRERQKIYADYKANRSAAPEDLPYQIGWAFEFCQLFGLPTLCIPGVEADDTMGSVALWAEKEGATVYLCTGDKDICQLVGQNVYVLHTHKENALLDAGKVEEVYGVPPERMTDFLALTGDTSDNIPGVRGIGPKTAASLLKEFGSLENLLSNLDRVTGKKRESLVQEAETARFSKKLAVIDTNVAFPKETEFFSVRPPDVEKLTAFYKYMNFSSLLKELPQAEELQSTPSFEESPCEYHLITTQEELEQLLAYLKEAKEICFDTETTDLSPFRAQLVGIGFSIKANEAFYVPCNGPLERKKVIGAFKELFEDGQRRFYGHNVKYDLHALAGAGIFVPTVSFDTMLASYLLHSHSHRHSLDHLALQYLGKGKSSSVAALIKKAGPGATMANVPIEDVSLYCCQDVDLTFQLRQLLGKELEERRLKTLFTDLELPLLRVLEQMERTGIYVDSAHLQRMAHDFGQKLDHLEMEIHELAGEEFKINSPKQLSAILFEKLGIRAGRKTATGHASTNAEVLTLLQHEHPIIGKIQEYRMLEKLRSTYLETLPQDVNERTGRIHPTFNQSVAATGRLSCQDPNLQNIPIRTEEGRSIREAFRPQKEGWSYLGADYSQIELRLLAHLSEDETLVQAFLHGEDIHAFTASEVFGVPLQEVTAEQRRHAKAVNFGIVYGQQAFGLAQELGIPMREAAEFIEAYFLRYPKVKGFIQVCKERARREGKAISMTGRERLIPDIHSKNPTLRAAAERLAINTPLQGSAADLIKLAMLEVETQLKARALKAQMILQVHDELLFEVPDSELLELEPLVRKGMEEVALLRVPLVVDISIGKNWKEC